MVDEEQLANDLQLFLIDEHSRSYAIIVIFSVIVTCKHQNMAAKTNCNKISTSVARKMKVEDERTQKSVQNLYLGTSNSYHILSVKTTMIRGISHLDSKSVSLRNTRH